MLHKYRKTTTIQAEQFDGTDEMIEKYGIIPDSGFVTPHHWSRWLVLPTKEGNMKVDKGDWIATGIKGEYWVIDGYLETDNSTRTRLLQNLQQS